MPSLTIKNIPDGLLTRLRERAQGHHRSLQGEVMTILEGAVQSKRLTISEVRKVVKDLGLKTGDDSTTWIRELRDAH